MKLPPDPPDEVGYGKPPTHSQFKKGKSGSPAGRPKGSRNANTVFDAALAETVVVNQNGRHKKISKRQAAMIQLANKAASGDLSAIAKVLEQQNRHAPHQAPTPLDTPEDQAVFADFIACLTGTNVDKEKP